MRIGLLTTSFPRHAEDVAGNFVLGFARALAARGHTIEVLAPEPAEPTTLPRWPGIEVRWVPYMRPRRWACTFYGAGVPDNLRADARAWLGLAPFTGALALSARRRARNWDAVASHWALPSACAAAFARRGRPHLAVLHSADVHLLARLPARALWAATLARGATTLAFVSEGHRDRFLGWLPCDLRSETARRAYVQPMGIEAPPRSIVDRETARRDFGMQGFTLVTLGRLVPVKGLVEAARALAGVAGLEWWIGGDGPERAALERVARNSRAHIRVLGEVHGARKEALLHAADAFVLPSRALASGRTEGAPTALIEAMARGLPVIASNVGGIPELVRSEHSGLLFDPEDARALVHAVTRLRDDVDLRAALGVRARESAAHLAWERIAPRLEGWLVPSCEGAFSAQRPGVA